MTDNQPDDYYVVRNHPDGGYAVVRASVNESEIPEVDRDTQDRFMFLRSACNAAYTESIEGKAVGYTIHPEVEYMNSRQKGIFHG